MAHVRQQIRDAVAAAVTGLPITGSRVYVSRVYPLGADHIPGLCVYTTKEELLSRGTRESGLERRKLSVIVEARVKPGSGTDPDDQLDDIVADVETALMSNATLSGLTPWIQMESVEMEFDALERPVGRAVMTWECVYIFDAADPETVIDWSAA
jgi:hypothetical protein